MSKDLVNEPNLVYIKKWMKTKTAVLFRLSNKIVQVDFKDKTKMILSSNTKMVFYIDAKGLKKTYPIESAINSSNE